MVREQFYGIYNRSYHNRSYHNNMSLFKRNKNFAPAEPLIWKKTWDEMNEKLETLKTRNNYLVRQNMELAEAKDAVIKAKDAEINAKDAEIKAKDAENETKTNQLGEKHQKMRAEIDQLRQAAHAMATSEKMRTAYLAKIAKEEEEKKREEKKQEEEEKREEKKAREKRKKTEDLYMGGAPAGIPYQFHYKKTRNPMPLHSFYF